MISLKPWRLFLYITRAMTSLLFANAGPVTFKAPASLQPNIALLPAQGYQKSNLEICTKKIKYFRIRYNTIKNYPWTKKFREGARHSSHGNLPPPRNP